MKVYFSDIAIGKPFDCEGQRYIKTGSTEAVGGLRDSLTNFAPTCVVSLPEKRKPTGGFAYPNDLHDGLTVRDAFFIAILQGMIAGDYVIEDDAVAIRTAYHMADLAIAEREK